MTPQLRNELFQPSCANSPILRGIAYGLQLAHNPEEALDES